MYPIALYLQEIRVRLFYFVASLACTACVILIKFNNVVLVLVISSKGTGADKFLISHLMELINTVMSISLQIGSLVSFPFFCLQVRFFLSNCWYYYQRLLLVKYQNFVFVNLSVYSGVIHWILIPSIISFSLHWFNHMNIWILKLNLLLELDTYIRWYLHVYYSFVLIFFLAFFLPLCLTFNIYPLFLYMFVKYNKKYIFFIITLLLFLVNFSDHNFQLILLFLIIFMVECLFFLACLKKIRHSW